MSTPIDDAKATAAKQAFAQARAALAAVKAAQLPGGRADYERAIAIALRQAVESGVTQPEDLAKAAYAVILAGPARWLEDEHNNIK